MIRVIASYLTQITLTEEEAKILQDQGIINKYITVDLHKGAKTVRQSGSIVEFSTSSYDSGLHKPCAIVHLDDGTFRSFDLCDIILLSNSPVNTLFLILSDLYEISAKLCEDYNISHFELESVVTKITNLINLARGVK